MTHDELTQGLMIVCGVLCFMVIVGTVLFKAQYNRWKELDSAYWQARKDTQALVKKLPVFEEWKEEWKEVACRQEATLKDLEEWSKSISQRVSEAETLALAHASQIEALECWRGEEWRRKKEMSFRRLDELLQSQKGVIEKHTVELEKRRKEIADIIATMPKPRLRDARGRYVSRQKRQKKEEKQSKLLTA